MLKFKILAYLFMWLFLINFVNAANIYGTVYDLSLKKVNNARVEINTQPKQFMITPNGTYSFNVPNGAYTIKAQLIQKTAVIAFIQEDITIKQDGTYVLDLILFPDVEEGIEAVEIDVNENIIEKEKNNILIVSFILIILGIILIVIYYFKIKKHKKEIKGEEDGTNKEESYNDLQQIIKIIKQEGGRATQRDIRKQIPLSEAKISLMIAELEHKGVIEKIKKGRGNIIILKKN